jgi:dolichol-phosphate mannosyltransferase
MIPSLQQLQQPIRFGLVGLSGVVVNTTVLWALARGAHLAVPLASALATETAILSNFMLNDRWTFRATMGHHRFLTRLARFNSVSLGGMAITAGLLMLLISYAGLHLLLANLLAIGGAMAWNYVVNSRWTWRRQEAGDRRQETGDKNDAISGLGSHVSGLMSTPVVDEEVAV